MTNTRMSLLGLHAVRLWTLLILSTLRSGVLLPGSKDDLCMARREAVQADGHTASWLSDCPSQAPTDSIPEGCERQGGHCSDHSAADD
jgi:hypothetical protein